MVLAVPHIQTLKFEKIPKKIFDQLENSTEYHPPLSLYRCGSIASEEGAEPLYLPVISHGSYNVVVVPSMADLDRVPPAFALMDEPFKAAMRAAYVNTGYGAALCKLRSGSTDYEPFAYSHATLATRKLFVPTLHIHRSGASGSQIHMNHADWDHFIYSFSTIPHISNSEDWIPKSTNKVSWGKVPAEFRHSPQARVRCLEISGEGARVNEDILLPISTFDDDEFSSRGGPYPPFPLYRGI